MAAGIVYFVNVWLIKLVFFVVFLEIASRFSPKMRIFLYLVGTYTVVSFTYAMANLLLTCRPLSHSWYCLLNCPPSTDYG